MENNKTITATLAALGAQIIFGFSFMFTKIALDYASPMTVIADRYLVAFLGMTLVMLIKKTKIKFNKSLWKLALMSLFQPLLYFVFETYGIKLTTSAFSSIMISMIPVVSMVSGIFLLREIPSPMQYVFTALSVAGVVIMALAGNADGTVTPLGVILLMGAVVSSVGYNIASRKISAEFSVMERTYAMTLIGTVSFMTIALVQNLHDPAAIFEPFAHTAFLWGVLYLGVASSVVAFLFLNFANTYLPVAKTTVFSNITTAVSVVTGVLFLNETLSIKAIISTVMIITGVFGVQFLNMKKTR